MKLYWLMMDRLIQVEEYVMTPNLHLPNIQVKHIKNSGVAVARNLGIALSNGKFLYFVDPDDYLTESFL